MGPLNVDAITFEVVTSALVNITELMGETLRRVSRSPIIYDSVDFSNAIFDARCRLVAQTTNVPVHLASMHFSAEQSVRRFEGQIHEHDIIVLNDPYMGGTHIPDVTFTMPVFHEGELFCFAASRGHWTDLGGGAVGSRVPTAVHVAQEGLRLPPVKIYDRGQVVQAVRDIIGANTRVPEQNLGDMEGHRAALLMAEKEIHKLVKRYGALVIKQCMEGFLDYTETRTRRAIANLPDGTYQAEDFVDCDGATDQPYYIRVALTVAGEEIKVDFAGTDPMAKGGINYPYAGTHSAVYWALKFFLDAEAPPNAGMYRPVEIVLPENSFINAKWPAPVFMGNMITSERIADTIWQALARAVGRAMVGMPYADSNGVTLGGMHNGRSFVFMDLPPGGWGGTPNGDGMSATYSRHGNCMDLDIELAELLYPVRITRRELIRDSGGPGQYRGGLSLRVGFTPSEAELVIGHTTSRTKQGPPGMFGGRSGRPGRSLRNYGQRDQEVLAGWSEDGSWRVCMFDNVKIPLGQDVTLELQGGGGWGPPLQRDRALVEQDLRDEYISPQRAKEDYGYESGGGRKG